MLVCRVISCVGEWIIKEHWLFEIRSNYFSKKKKENIGRGKWRREKTENIEGLEKEKRKKKKESKWKQKK